MDRYCRYVPANVTATARLALPVRQAPGSQPRTLMKELDPLQAQEHPWSSARQRRYPSPVPMLGWCSCVTSVASSSLAAAPSAVCLPYRSKGFDSFGLQLLEDLRPPNPVAAVFSSRPRRATLLYRFEVMIEGIFVSSTRSDGRWSGFHASFYLRATSESEALIEVAHLLAERMVAHGIGGSDTGVYRRYFWVKNIWNWPAAYFDCREGCDAGFALFPLGFFERQTLAARHLSWRWRQDRRLLHPRPRREATLDARIQPSRPSASGERQAGVP